MNNKVSVSTDINIIVNQKKSSLSMNGLSFEMAEPVLAGFQTGRWLYTKNIQSYFTFTGESK